MRRTEAREAVRMAMFLNILNRWEPAELNQEEAVELLGRANGRFGAGRAAHEEDGEGLAFTPVPGVDLDEILCVEEERQVGNDNCVS
jgi:hypothetical protein